MKGEFDCVYMFYSGRHETSLLGGLLLGHRLPRWPNIKVLSYLASIGHSHNAVSMLSHRLRRLADIETALREFPVFAGKFIYLFIYLFNPHYT